MATARQQWKPNAGDRHAHTTLESHNATARTRCKPEWQTPTREPTQRITQRNGEDAMQTRTANNDARTTATLKYPKAPL